MTNKTIYNVETGEIETRPMSKDELAQLKIDIENDNQRRADKVLKEATKQTILDRLGITADEAALLLS